MHEFIKWTATEAVAHLRQGDVTPLELIDAAEIQIAQTNPQINALVTLCMTRARERAQVLMRERKHDSHSGGLLCGLPIAVKTTPMSKVCAPPMARKCMPTGLRPVQTWWCNA